MIGVRGIHHGMAWEVRVAYQARLEDLLLVNHGASVRRVSQAKMIAIKSDLDFRLGARDGRIVFFDTKSFGDKPYATRSQWTPHQMQRVQLYASYGQTAGMLVLFRVSGEVVFFGAPQLANGNFKRYDSECGLRLGVQDKFQLKILFQVCSR